MLYAPFNLVTFNKARKLSASFIHLSGGFLVAVRAFILVSAFVQSAVYWRAFAHTADFIPFHIHNLLFAVRAL